MSGEGFDSVAALLGALNEPGTRARAALTFYRGRTRVGGLSYGELLDRVGEAAAYLERTLGVRRGDRVLILTPNRLEVPVLLLAIMRLGAVAVPVNPTTPAEDWGYIANHSEARVAFVAPDLKQRLGVVYAGPQFDIAELFALADGLRPGVAAPGLDRELAIVLYTSGTTGNPKGVGLCQSNLLRNGWSMALNFDLRQSTQFAVLPLYHAHALGFGLMTSLTTGGHLVFTDKLDPFAWCDVIRAESVDYTSVVPSLLPMLLAARVHRDKVPTLKAMLVSSAPLSTELAREFIDKTGIDLIQGWGLSEYTNFACCVRPGDSAESRRKFLFGFEGTSIGSPLAGTEVKIVGLDGKSLAEGEAGELCVRGHSLMLAYYRDPDATRATFAEGGWLKTGDQGVYRVHEGKPVFFVTGRIKEIIIRSGEKYSPLAIEKKLLASLPELEGKLVVLGFAHRAHGEEIGAYLELADLPVEFRERLARAIEDLPLETRPKVLLHGGAPIPRTHTGKIQRRKLQPAFAAFVDCRGPLRIERTELL
jgi:long-chain acyl-CoA synthetase